MNAAEKIAATYLRLNGFLLVPQFTVFEGDRHSHVDLVGIRAAGSREIVKGETLPTDGRLFTALEAGGIVHPRDTCLGLVAEVKTNDSVERPSDAHVAYVGPFLGDLPLVLSYFSESASKPQWVNGCLAMSTSYALWWIFQRVKWMDAEFQLTKSGSWTWSDDPLSDLLIVGSYLRQY
jgi:hypothetical protein